MTGVERPVGWTGKDWLKLHLEAEKGVTGKWHTRLVTVEDNGTRHILSPWLDAKDEAEVRRRAEAENAILSVVEAR